MKNRKNREVKEDIFDVFINIEDESELNEIGFKTRWSEDGHSWNSKPYVNYQFKG
ncbi:MAG: hypothetical protein WDA09_02245 [Bacteriovoracaceae bacterium]